MMRIARNVAIFALGITVATSAPAELNDPPYFNLWSGTGQNGEAGGLASTGDEIRLCGTNACTADNTTPDWAIFRTVPANYGKGSGAIDPFLRFQHNEFQPGSQTWEAAYNTDFRSTSTPTNTGMIHLDKDQFDPALSPSEEDIFNQAKDTTAGGFNPDPFNHALMLGDLRQAIDSEGFFHFLLDVNEPGNAKATLRLDELAFFVAASNTMNDFTQDTSGTSGGNLATAALQELDANGNQIGTADKVWDMDWNGMNPGGSGAVDANGDPLGGLVLDNINDSGPAGSGDYDMELLLSASLFQNYLDTDYVYLYNFAGEADAHSENEAEAGFEEWAFDTSAGGPPPPGVAEPASLLLMSVGLVGLVVGRRRRTAY